MCFDSKMLLTTCVLFAVDYNRVILKSAELNVLGSDYINANHIHVC